MKSKELAISKLVELLRECKGVLIEISEANTYHGTTNAVIAQINHAVQHHPEDYDLLRDMLTDTRNQIEFLSEKYGSDTSEIIKKINEQID